MINAYRNSWLNALKNFTSIKKKIGVWAPSCIQHSFSHHSDAFNGASYKIPNSIGMTISTSISTFLNNPDSLLNIHIDTVDWPKNSGCSSYIPDLKNRIQLTT